MSSIGTNATSILGKINNDEKLEQDLNLSSAGLAAGAIFFRWLGNRLDKDGDIPGIDSEHIYRSFFQHNESAMYAFYTLNTACSYSWVPLPPNFELGFNISATMRSGLGKVCDKFSYLYKSKFLNRENRKSRQEAFVDTLKGEEKIRKKKTLKNQSKIITLYTKGIVL